MAACTVEEAGIELSVRGNGLGNVYDEVARPRLTGLLRSRTDRALTVNVTTELIPFDPTHSEKKLQLRLDAGQAESFDALAAPITERGHYRGRGRHVYPGRKNGAKIDISHAITMVYRMSTFRGVDVYLVE